MAKKRATSKPKTTARAAKTTPSVQVAAAGTKTAPRLADALRKWNLGLAFVLAVEALAMLLYGGTKTAALTLHYLSVDTLASDANGHQVLAAAARHLVDVRVSWLAAAVVAVWALGYLVLATVYRKQYQLEAQGLGPARWLSFGVGSGLLLATIALVSGVHDVGALLLIFVTVAFAGTMVPVGDKLNQEGKGWLPHAVCAGLLLASFMPIVMFGLNVLGAVLYGGHISGQLYALYAVGLVLYVAWAWLVHERVVRKWRLKDGLFTERAAMVLGVVTASALGWLVVATTF